MRILVPNFDAEMKYKYDRVNRTEALISRPVLMLRGVDSAQKLSESSQKY